MPSPSPPPPQPLTLYQSLFLPLAPHPCFTPSTQPTLPVPSLCPWTLCWILTWKMSLGGTGGPQSLALVAQLAPPAVKSPHPPFPLPSPPTLLCQRWGRAWVARAARARSSLPVPLPPPSSPPPPAHVAAWQNPTFYPPPSASSAATLPQSGAWRACWGRAGMALCRPYPPPAPPPPPPPPLPPPAAAALAPPHPLPAALSSPFASATCGVQRRWTALCARLR